MANVPEISIITTENYKYGLINKIEPESIKRGAASETKNWITRGDHIELRPGQQFMGDVNGGDGITSGIRKVVDAVSVEHLFGTYGKKAKYYDNASSLWVEIGSDILGDDVVDSNGLSSEDISMQEYTGTAGSQLFLNSPNCAGYFKIMVANPGDYSDVYSDTKNFKGYIKIDTNRTFLWGRVKDLTGVYGSYIDAQNYTTVSAEAITDVASGTLGFKSGNPTRTCFGIQITVTAGGEIFTDDYNGNLTGSLGHTGTINYTTGAFTTTASGAGTADYQWENSNNGGITDFTFSGTRLAGEGFIFRQDEGGGPVQNINTYSFLYFCMHLKKTWVLNIQADDTDATNLPYRDKVGIPNSRASVETGEGIYYIDDSNPDDVFVRLLTYQSGGSDQIVPVAVSANLNLSAYLFDKCATISWGEFVLFACRLKNSERNNRVLLYNRTWKSWDILDYNVSCFEIFNGALVCGDSISNNFIELFSGFDDFDANIDNFWIGNLETLSLEGLKKVKKFYLRGLIARDQILDIYLSIDGGGFVLAGTIEGTGSYVSQTQATTIGSQIIGSSTIGGGSDGLPVYQYERLFRLNVAKLERVKIKYVARGLGYVSVSNQKYWDIRDHGRKVPAVNRG